MSWTQVYFTGLSRTIEPSDNELESLLDRWYDLSNNDTILWAGPDTTLIKRDENGCCRGFGFLVFYSQEGASIIIDRINSGYNDEAGTNGNISERPQLHAELASNPKGARKKNTSSDGDLPDLRLRRQRKAPVRKHPVIVSSNGKKTNRGNKTR